MKWFIRQRKQLSFRYCNGGRENGLNEDVQAVGRDRGLDWSVKRDTG